MYGPPQGTPMQPNRYSTPAQQLPPNSFSQQHHPHSSYQQNPHQYPVQDMNNPNPGRSSQSNQYGQPYPNKNVQLAQPPALIQPPALNVEDTMNTNSQFIQQRQPQMRSSNNQHSEFDTYHNQEDDPNWNNEEHIASMFWQQRCITMLDRFQWFFDRFEIIREEYVSLSEEMQKMDSQEQWHHFQQHHDQFHQKIVEMEQELAAVVGQNQQLLQQKMSQDSENVWEQRYQELLGNFKSLQEEMTNMEASGGRGGVPPEQYQHLEDQYNELGYQYEEACKEIEKLQNSEFQEQFEMQINQYQHQIQNYKLQFDSLHNENVELQHMIVDLENQSKNLQDRLAVSVEKSKFDQLAKLIDQKNREIESLEHNSRGKSSSQALINQYENALNQKNTQNQYLKQLINDKEREMEKQLNTEKKKLSNLQEQYDHDMAAQQERVNELERKIAKLQEKPKSSPQSSAKIENLQKKLAFSNQEITNLNDTLKNKNQELIQLRSLSYEIEKLREIQANYNKVVEERDRATDNLKKKQTDIEVMHKEIQNLNSKIQEVSNKRLEYSTRNLITQIDDLNEQLRKNQADLNKLKGIIELKDDYSLKLQQQLKKANDKVIRAQQTLLLQREDWKQKQIKLNTRNINHESKMKNLDHQFNLQLKETLEKEILSLRKANNEKQDIIRKMEEKEIVVASQLAVLQKQKNNYDQDIALSKSKEKELQSLNDAHSRRFKELESAFLNNNQEAEQIRLKHLAAQADLNQNKQQINDLNQEIKAKAKKIQELQVQIAEYIGKSEVADSLRNQNSKLKLALSAAQEENERFKMNSESRIAGSKVTTSAAKYEPEKQENPALLHLQQENQYLKEEIAKMLEKLTVNKAQTQKQVTPSYPNQHEPPTSDKTTGMVSVDLNKRLKEFNLKLQTTINQQNYGLQHSRSQQLVSFWENERKELIDKHQAEKRILMEQLNQAKASTVTEAAEKSESPRKQHILELQSQKLKEQSDFYKQKSKELQDRNQSLIAINEQLQQKISSVLKLKQSTSTNDYYKQQNKQLTSDNDVLKNKLKKMNEDSKQLRMELASKNSKIKQQYQYKLLELELVMQEQKRKIAYLQAGQPTPHKDKEEKSIQQPFPSANYNYPPSKPSPSPSSNQQSKKTIKDNKKDYLPTYSDQSPKKSKQPGHIELEFQSVLGNLRDPTRPYEEIGGKYTSSYDYKSYGYEEYRPNDYSYPWQKI